MFCVNSDGARRAVDVSGGAGYSPYQAFRASASASFTATSQLRSSGRKVTRVEKTNRMNYELRRSEIDVSFGNDFPCKNVIAETTKVIPISFLAFCCS